MKYNIIIIVAFTILSSCKKAKHNPECKNGNNDFSTLYVNLSNDHEYENSYDTYIHEYTFSLSEKKTICEIGYQSQRKLKNTPYLIEIIRNSDSIIILSKSQKFKHNKTSYFIPDEELLLNANESYTLRRTQTQYKKSISEVIGRYATKRDMEFPYSQGVITVTSSKFGNNSNIGIPYIDIIFKE